MIDGPRTAAHGTLAVDVHRRQLMDLTTGLILLPFPFPSEGISLGGGRAYPTMGALPWACFRQHASSTPRSFTTTVKGFRKYKHSPLTAFPVQNTGWSSCASVPIELQKRREDHVHCQGRARVPITNAPPSPFTCLLLFLQPPRGPRPPRLQHHPMPDSAVCRSGRASGFWGLERGCLDA